MLHALSLINDRRKHAILLRMHAPHHNFLIDYRVGEGDSCFRSLLLGTPATEECMTGLRCDRTSAKCVKGERNAFYIYKLFYTFIQISTS